MLNRMHKTRLHIIRIFALQLLLLMAGGMLNEAWGRITYHILSLPFDTYQRDGTNNIEGSTVSKFQSNVRVEALCCWGNDQYVGLPNEYKSPLIGDANYHYYLAEHITKSDKPQKLYGYTNSTYYFYTINGSVDNADNSSNYLAPGTEMTGDVDIYVTYTYNPNDAGASMHMDLSATRNYTGDGLLSSSQEYNIRLKDRMLVLNQNRQNRPGAVKDGFYTEEDLHSDDFRWIEAGGLNNVGGYRFFKFQFGGNDPYNVTIYTAYNKPTTLRTKDKNNVAFELNGNQSDYDKYIGKGKNVYKEYRGASFFAKLKDGVVDGNNMWLSSEADLQWTDLMSEGAAKKDNATIKVVPGYFKGPSDHDYNKSISNYYEMSPIFNSFAILNHSSGTGYVLAASKMNVGNSDKGVNNWQPRSSDGAIQFLDYDGNGNNVKLTYKAPADVSSIVPYEVKKYILRVVTPFNNNIDATIEWSDKDENDEITVSMIPESLRRKYVGYTGFFADAAHNTSISTFADAQDKCAVEDGKTVVYVGYQTTADMPFTAMGISDSYTSATWYELTDADDATNNKKIKWDTSDNKFKSSGTTGSYSKEGEFAFMGDPYELRVVNRYLSETNTGNRYVASPASNDNPLTHSATRDDNVCKWYIPNDDTEGSFLLKRYDDDGYWQWTTGTVNTIKYQNSTSTRIKVIPIGTLNYTFKIVDLAGNIAVAATVAKEPFSALSGFASIPADIRSPFLADELVSYYSTYTGGGRSYLDGSISALPGTGCDIFISYTTTNLSGKSINLTSSQVFNVKLNDRYIYKNNSDKIVASSEPSLETDPYKWRLEGSDPYAIKIYNVGAGKYVKVDGEWGDNKALTFESSIANGSRFVAMMGGSSGIYEVLAASEGTTYYHIGRATGEDTETKIYLNSTYAHGADELRFVLEMDVSITYHIIDKAKQKLGFTIVSRNARLSIPEEYVSPLVSNYYFYSTRAEAELYRTDGTVGTRITEISAESDHNNDVWVVYDTNDRVEYGVGSKMYRLKFDDGDTFHQEDGHDHMNATAQKAIYPYINGDCNFFVYGEDELQEQLAGASSTRTRWAWYLESANSDPYHVKIVSRQQEPDAQQVYQRMYFRTYVVNYGGANHVVTGTTTPGVTEVLGTEYMVLGQPQHYKLVTVDEIDDGSTTERRTVTSFEQYWKTWETITDGVTKKDSDNNNPNIDDQGNVTVDLSFSEAVSADVRSTVEAGLHTYTAWAKSRPTQKKQAAKRFANETHYYHTVNMGTGTFDFEEMEVTPVLVLLDQRGWEIMRKPLPTGTDDPEKEAKYDAIRPYNSPMVKEYKFWSKPTKARNHHYYKVANPITKSATSDEPYISTDLTQLPPITAKNVKDNYGDLNDQYVTYVTKDEYLVSDMTFLIQQGESFAKTTDGNTITTESVGTGLSDKIMGGTITNQMQWTLGSKGKDALNTEMGLGTDTYPDSYTKGLISLDTFDPYNVQIQSVSNSGRYFTSNATNAVLDEGSTVSTTNAGTGVTLTDGAEKYTALTYDNSTLHVTNSTFMVVQDENGNMQLMPRFDQYRRVSGLNGMANATTASADDTSGSQTTFLVRPRIHEYIIVDNQGDESLRYKLAGDSYPSIPAQFQSPLASGFQYYKTLTADGTDHDYTIGSIGGEITGSLAEAELTYSENTAQVYVRYQYDESADHDRDNLLQGPWLSMTLGGSSQWVEYAGTLNADGGIYTDTKPDTSEGLKAARQWHWKFLGSPFDTSSSYYVAPDPYRVELYNRQANGGSDANMSTPIKIGSANRFALVSHSSGEGYALAAAGEKDYNYQFLNGSGMTAPSSTPASLVTEASFGSSGTISDNAKITVNNDIAHTYTYKVLTNALTLAVSHDQTDTEAQGNSYSPVIPYDIQSPLLNQEDYKYYGTATDANSDGVYEIDTKSLLDKLYGLYEDEVYVRYTYDKNTSPFRVPNERNAVGNAEDPVGVGSGTNYSPLDISGQLGYNIIWLDDKMMYYNSGTIGSKVDQALSGDNNDEWIFEGGDPYALKIKNKSGDLYVDGTATLESTTTPPQTFMLLKKENYDYGMLAKTGAGGYRLTDYGQTVTAENGDPNKYIIFALATHDLIYTLRNPISGESAYIINYRTEINGSKTALNIPVTTKRTVRATNYSLHAGKVSLGDVLETPSAMSRPYCSYTYYIEKITYSGETTAITELEKYEGLKCEDLPDDVDLINKDVYVDVVYDYNTSDVFEHQKDYKANPEFRFYDANEATTTRWYTLDTRTATPALMNYKLTDNTVGTAEGRDLHYTNDYLWTVEGDPYGFYIHNRYAAKNASSWSSVITTASDPAADVALTMSETTTYAVYEMTPTSVNGYFRLHPMNKGGIYVYNLSGTPKLSATSVVDWKFTLDEAQVKPYKDRAGYVGGLNSTGKTSYDAAGTLIAKQGIVYTNSNIQGYSQGYYRLTNIPGASGVSTARYLSGYRNKIEADYDDDGNPETASVQIPIHFYERKGVTNTVFDDLGTNNDNYTRIPGQWGDVPVPAPEYDAASIFYFKSSTSPTRILTQDLEVVGNKMTATTNGGTQFTVEDLGGAVVSLHDGNATIGSRNYLHYNQASTIFDAKYGTGVELADHSKWCMEPANDQGLLLSVNSGGTGDDYYYATFYAPFDVSLPSAVDAYTCSTWNNEIIHPVKVAASSPYAEGKFVPAGSAVIIRSTSSSAVKLTLPNTTPSNMPLTSCFLGSNLTGKLDAVDPVRDIYTLGLPMTGSFTQEGNYNTSGEIKAVTPERGLTGIGFYINANPNREADPSKALWKRNNLYVLANKIYHRAAGGGAREKTRGIEFVPVIFDDEGGEELHGIRDEADRVGDGCVYDLLGRKVATKEQVEDGTWRQQLRSGIYIINGKKIRL